MIDEEHIKPTWFEDYLKLFPKESQKETCKIVCKEVCQKILKETKKMWQEDFDYFSDLKGIIKNLGVEV